MSRGEAEIGAWSGLPADWESDTLYDGGDKGCGEMVLSLKLHLLGLTPGESVAVRANDPGAPIDLPAWCRVTGNELIAAKHPYYLMRVRERHES